MFQAHFADKLSVNMDLSTTQKNTLKMDLLWGKEYKQTGECVVPHFPYGSWSMAVLAQIWANASCCYLALAHMDPLRCWAWFIPTALFQCKLAQQGERGGAMGGLSAVEDLTHRTAGSGTHEAQISCTVRLLHVRRLLSLHTASTPRSSIFLNRRQTLALPELNLSLIWHQSISDPLCSWMPQSLYCLLSAVSYSEP